jgi:multidrug efflux pump subunit AcrA (membrane-fusion protein)
MRFVTRSLMGLMLMTLTLALLALAGSTIFGAFKNRTAGGFGGREARERVFTVEVAPVTLATHAPEIRTYGEVISGRTLELRAAASGEIVQISPNFREGGMVKKGELLFQTDPATAKSRLLIAKNELAESQSDLIDARRNLTLAQDEVRAAETQLALRTKAMVRQQDLRGRGLGTDTATETAELATSSAEQTLLAKRLSLANAQANIARSETLVGRRQINADEAARLLNDTTVLAEFDGVLSEISVVQGRLVNANEKLGQLIDPEALEVSFRVSSDEFRSLAATDGGLQQAQVLVSVGSDDTATFSGQIDRVSAAVGAGKTGRELFAKVQNAAKLSIQPGDFVAVTLREPAMENVARIPASAASSNGEVLVVTDDNRLEVATVEILRKQGNHLIVRADTIANRSIVLSRAPQLGAGIRIEPRAAGGPAIVEKKMVKLEPERRHRILAMLQDNTRMPKNVRDHLIKTFQAEEVSQEALDQIEARMAANATPSAPDTGETVQITEDQRQRMIAYVQGNENIPADRKTQILETLAQPQVPKAMVDRLTARMGS